MQQLVNQHPKSPHIRLRSIYVVDESLRRHVNRRPDVNILKLLPSYHNILLGELSKPKICDLSLAIMQKHIGNLQIAMYDILLREVNQPLKDVLDDGFSPILIKVLLFPQSRLKIALVAQLSYDVAVSIAGEHLVTFQHIGVV